MRRHSKIFSSNSEADASELLENIEEICRSPLSIPQVISSRFSEAFASEY